MAESNTTKRILRFDDNYIAIQNDINLKQQQLSRHSDCTVSTNISEYIDNSRNISVVAGPEDLKKSITEKHPLRVRRDPLGSSKEMFLKEAQYFMKRNNIRCAEKCSDKAKDYSDDIYHKTVTIKAEIQMKKGNYKEALNLSGSIVALDKHNGRALYIKAESLFNLCYFEKALVVFHRGKEGGKYLYKRKPLTNNWDSVILY